MSALASTLQAYLGKQKQGAASLVIAATLLPGCGERSVSDKQMQMLCTKDGGTTIFETIYLPKSQFDKWGMPRGKNWTHSDLESKLDPDYRYSYSSEFIARGDPLKGEVEMYKATEEVYRQSDGKLLGKRVTYGRRGGDPYIALMFGAHPSSSVCPIQSKTLISSIFIPGE